MFKHCMTAMILLSAFTVSTCFAEETNATVRQSLYRDLRPTEVTTRTESPKVKAKSYSAAQLEQHALVLINQNRVQNGVPPLTSSKQLQSLARDLAHDLVKHDSFDHKTSDGLTTKERAAKRGINCAIYENLGSQSGPDSALQMVTDIQQTFMNEPLGEPNHRYVLLHPKHLWVGVGIAQGKDRVVMVQNFTQVDPSQ